MIDIAGNLDIFRLGNNPRNGEVFKLFRRRIVWLKTCLIE
jgi:hypothetical protein